jgi:hypothetical protein
MAGIGVESNENNGINISSADKIAKVMSMKSAKSALAIINAMALKQMAYRLPASVTIFSAWQ